MKRIAFLFLGVLLAAPVVAEDVVKELTIDVDTWIEDGAGDKSSATVLEAHDDEEEQILWDWDDESGAWDKDDIKDIEDDMDTDIQHIYAVFWLHGFSFDTVTVGDPDTNDLTVKAVLNSVSWDDTWTWDDDWGNDDGVTKNTQHDGGIDANPNIQTYLIASGDADMDGDVDASDLNIFGLNEWNSSDGDPKVFGWRNADFNGDGYVDSSDLNEIGRNWREEVWEDDDAKAEVLIIDMKQAAEAWWHVAADNGYVVKISSSASTDDSIDVKSSDDTDDDVIPRMYVHYDDGN